MPKVSICVPAYNHPKLIQRVLNSILAQDYENYEVIITDDSEGDEVQQLVSEFKDKRIYYFKNANRLGSPANWNRSIRLAKGDYIKIVHHDDWFPNKHCLEQFVKLLDENPQSVLGFSSSYECRSDGSVAYVHAPSSAQLEDLHANPTNLMFGNFVGAPSAVIFRHNVHDLFDEKLKWLVDVDFYITLLSSSGGGYSYINEPQVNISAEGSHKVTNECIGNRKIEIFENVFLFNKTQKMRYKPSSTRFLIYFSLLLSRFKSTTVDEFGREANLQRIPLIYRSAILMAAFIRTLRNIRHTASELLNRSRDK